MAKICSNNASNLLDSLLSEYSQNALNCFLGLGLQVDRTTVSHDRRRSEFRLILFAKSVPSMRWRPAWAMCCVVSVACPCWQRQICPFEKKTITEKLGSLTWESIGVIFWTASRVCSVVSGSFWDLNLHQYAGKVQLTLHASCTWFTSKRPLLHRKTRGPLQLIIIV